MSEHRHIDPELLEAARQSGTLRRMIRRGVPLTRQMWIEMNWGGDVPKPWTAEDEDEVPEPWRDPSKVGR